MVSLQFSDGFCRHATTPVPEAAREVRMALENLALLRHLALNIIKRNTDKGSSRLKFKRAGWDDRFLEKLISEIA